MCRCGQDGDQVVRDNLRLDRHVRRGLQEVRNMLMDRNQESMSSFQVESVKIEYCPNLQLDLDLININASTVTLLFR